MAVRKGRIRAEFRRAALTDLALLEIAVDTQTDSRAWGETLKLADRFRLTVYDAAYLEFAQRRSFRWRLSTTSFVPAPPVSGLN